MKKMLVLLLVALLSVSMLVACGGGGEDNAEATLESAIKVGDPDTFAEMVEELSGMGMDIDMKGNQLIFTMQNELFNSFVGVEAEEFESMINPEDMYDSLGFPDMVEQIKGDYPDITGAITLLIEFATTDGEVIYSIEFDENGVM